MAGETRANTRRQTSAETAQKVGVTAHHMHTLARKERSRQKFQTVPAERLVTCPKCGEPKPTKAAQNVRLKCGKCGAPFLAPAVTDEGANPPSASPGSEPSTPAPRKSRSTSGGSGVKVVKASSVKVRSNAKTRKPKDSVPAKTAKLPSSPADESAGSPPAGDLAPPPHQSRSKIAGRRGGLGFYKRRVRGYAS